MKLVTYILVIFKQNVLYIKSSILFALKMYEKSKHEETHRKLTEMENMEIGDPTLEPGWLSDHRPANSTLSVISLAGFAPRTALGGGCGVLLATIRGDGRQEIPTEFFVNTSCR